MANHHTQDNTTDEVREIETDEFEGKQFAVVPWLIDVTGWRSIDEIFHIMAYMPNKEFSNYILPLSNLNLVTQRQYRMKIITQINGRRLLKDLERNDIINTTNENCCLIDFISWLEENRGNTSGIILLTYEMNEKMPVTLLAALERNHLLERFMKVVKGFANVYNIAKCVCPNYKDYSFKIVTQSLLKKEPDWNQLTKTCYELFLKLVQISSQRNEESEDIDSRSLYLIKSVLKTTREEKEELDHLRTIINKQNAWKPLFRDTMSSNWRNRVYSTKLRKSLVEKNVNFENLQSEYEKGGKDAVVSMLTKIKINDEDSRSIAELVDCYFNGENRIVVPKEWSKVNFRKTTSKTSNKKGDRNSNDLDNATAESAEDTEV